MTIASAKVLVAASTVNLLFAISSLSLPALTPNISSNAQTDSPVRTLAGEFVPEPGSPVAVGACRTELDLDPFGTPIDARTYIDYKNIADRPIQAVKFRVRFVDAEGKDRGTFHAPDRRSLPPGGQGAQKWRTEKVDPRVAGVKVRVLLVKMADGSVWASARMQDLASPLLPASGQPGAAASEVVPGSASGAGAAPPEDPFAGPAP